MKSKKQTGRVTTSPQQHAAADLREASHFVRNVAYDYPAAERNMTRSAEKIMRKCI